MKSTSTRRVFLQQSTMAGLALASAGAWAAVQSGRPARKLAVAVMGLGRGFDHIKALLTLPDVVVAAVCDVDARRVDRASQAVEKQTGARPKGFKDVRQMLEDKTVEALFVAAPNHWHAPATILACAAGKHVYVEKPGSHNPREGEWMVAAARRNRRLVQMGNQRRSWPGIIEGIEKLRAGVIGRVFAARCWYNNSRASIGRGKSAPVPEWLDYSLWQGPAPERPYKDNLVHYHWHWHWHWGNGELGNNGVHALDVARWGLAVDAPRRVTYGGARYHFEDDQETPDTGVATFDFGACFATWEGSSCLPRPGDKVGFTHFYGDKGTLIIDGGGYRLLDPKGLEVDKKTGAGGDAVHIGNFLDAIRGDAKLNAEIEDAQKSTLLCHLGNIAWRTGRTINYDAAKGRIEEGQEAQGLWEREYRPGWKPAV